jgi:hypothetical protein
MPQGKKKFLIMEIPAMFPAAQPGQHLLFYQKPLISPGLKTITILTMEQNQEPFLYKIAKDKSLVPGRHMAS